MIRPMKFLGGLLLAGLLVACGGGGGSAGNTDGGGTGGGNGNGPSLVADFAVSTDKTTINNSGTDSVTLNVIAVDASRNVVSGAPVTVSADGNGVFVPGASDGLTNAAGAYTGTLTIGSDKSDRDITLTVVVNDISKSVVVRVIGSKLTLQAAPSAPAPGQQVELTATLVDSAGAPIPGSTITFGGAIAAVGGTATTNTAGIATRTFTAPAVAGNYRITASGSGVQAAEYQLSVFSTSVPAAVIPAGARPSLAASPNVLAVNSVGSTANKSTLRFLFLDPQNNPIQNVRVRFKDITTGLPRVGASIVAGEQTTLYTDASGTVTTQYVAGQNSSPTNGVTVMACYKASDFTSDADCPASVQANLTIAGQALAVSIGDDNLMTAGQGTYIKRFTVTVADAAGRAVPNAPVDVSVDLTHYGKGEFAASYLDANGVPVPRLSAVPQSLLAAYPSMSVDPRETVQRVWCPNEDTNRNGNVDPGENANGSVDSNGQPTLEPRKSDLLVSYNSPSVTTTNADGVLIVKVEFSQRFATWLAYRIRVTTNVAGSQGMAERQFVTNYLEGDEENGSFHEPPYGVGACEQAN